MLGASAAVSALEKNGGDRAVEEGSLDLRAESLYRSGDFSKSADAARAALRIDPRDRDASVLLRLVENRVAALRATQAWTGDAAAAPPQAAASNPRAEFETFSAGSSVRFRRSSAAPPPSAVDALNPNTPDYWDRQLHDALLKASDANIVGREYLSPMLRSGRVHIMVASPSKGDMKFANDWGDYDSEAGVARFNLVNINREIGEYDDFHKSDSSAQIHRIKSRVPMDAAQVDFITHRFLPLAIHEVGGHGAHAADLRAALGRSAAPRDLDTEILAWRMEAAAIQDERRRDPDYLREPTTWANAENEWVEVWKRNFSKNPGMISKYLVDLGYVHMYSTLAPDSPVTRAKIQNSLQLVQSRCRGRYDSSCEQAVMFLLSFVDLDRDPELSSALHAFQLNPTDPAARVNFMNGLYAANVLENQLDPKGLSTAAEYFRAQDARLKRIEYRTFGSSLWYKVAGEIGL